MNRMSESEAYKLARKMFSYNPETGIVTRVGPTIKSNGMLSRLGVGLPVGSPNKKGYLVTCICGKRVYVHRLAWLLQTGSWPIQEIDHINGEVDDNRWCNLRDVSHAVNVQNKRKKVGKDQHLPIGISEQVDKYGYRTFRVSFQRNYVCRNSARSSLDEAIALLQKFKEELEPKQTHEQN